MAERELAQLVRDTREGRVPVSRCITLQLRLKGRCPAPAPMATMQFFKRRGQCVLPRRHAGAHCSKVGFFPSFPSGRFVVLWGKGEKGFDSFITAGIDGALRAALHEIGEYLKDPMEKLPFPPAFTGMSVMEIPYHWWDPGRLSEDEAE